MSHVDPKVIRRTNTVLTAGTWFLIVGVVFYSLMTTTPFVAAHSAPGWEWSGFVLGLMVDVAFVMALQADSVLARYGAADPGPWPRRFRFFTGGASVFLNVWSAVQARDWVGVAVHLIAPALLLIVAEVGPVYRRAMAEALARAEQPAPVSTGQLAPSTPAPAEAAEEDTPQVEPVDTPAPEVDTPAPERLSTEDARKAIEAGWRKGLSTRETAELSTRTHQWVAREYNRLEGEHGPQPVPGQLQLMNAS